MMMLAVLLSFPAIKRKRSRVHILGFIIIFCCCGLFFVLTTVQLNQISNDLKTLRASSSLLSGGGVGVGVGVGDGAAGDKEEGRYALQFDPTTGRPTNLRLAFLGDSTCRHLFLSLSYFLFSGNPVTFNNATRRLIEGDFPTRKEYNHYILDSYNETLACDCYTPEGRFIPWGNTHKTWSNIYFHHDGNSDNGGNSDNNGNGNIGSDGNFLSHITKAGYFEAHGHWTPSQIYTNQTYMQTVSRKQYKIRSFLWAGNWEYAIRHHIATIVPKPEYVVINAGLWPHDLNNRTTFRSIRKALEDHNMTGIYKTTNKQIGDMTTELLPHDADGCDILHYCLNFSWTGLVSDQEGLYLDKAHFGPNVNANFTKQLLSLLNETLAK
jgi:hypothetical protein